MDTPIVDFVRGYAQSGTSRLHMPGHKGRSLLGFEPLDLTEIRGADELYEPEGIIAQSEANATRLFGTQHTYYSTEGSSQCIRAMLCLALQAAPAAGQRPVLLAARNAHKALLYAAALLDFDIQWLWPAPQDAGALCSCPVSAAKLTGALQGLAQQGKRPFGVYITSPDYLGGVQDIAALAEVCKDFGVPLLVDNTHDAYLRFLPQGGQHPIALGAAMSCDSGQKPLPLVTGGAYLHLGKNAPIQDEAAVRNALALFGSTSPSYLILQSLDKCNQVLSEGYPLLTTKKVFLKGVIHELLWFLRGDTNIKYLVDNGVHIWDNVAYRHYNELCVRHGVLPVGRETFLASAGVESPIEGYRFGDLNHVYGYQWRSWPRPDGGVVDQIAQAAGLIRTNPESRRIVVSAWNVAEIDAMALPPCHVLFQFYVAGGRLSCQLYQRSAATFLGVPINIASYALLTCMMAQVCGLQPGEFIHTLGDTHLYLNHLEQVDEQLSREPRPLPKLRLNPAVKSVFDFRYEDFTLEGYDPWPAIKAPMSF